MVAVSQFADRALTGVLKDNAGTVVDLTNLTFKAALIGPKEVQTDLGVTVTDATNGAFSVDLPTATTGALAVGSYRLFIYYKSNGDWVENGPTAVRITQGIKPE